jgi:hypothetical protein
MRDLCEHIAYMRVQMNPEKRTILPALAFRSFTSRYQKPTLSEGFQDIIEWDFKVCHSEISNPLPRHKSIDMPSLLAMQQSGKYGRNIGHEDFYLRGVMYLVACAFTLLLLQPGESLA